MTIYGVTSLDTFISEGDRGWSVKPTPAGALSDLSFWLRPGALWMPNKSTVIFDCPPEGILLREEMLAAIQSVPGWRSQPTRGGWYTCNNKKGPKTVHIGIRTWMHSNDPIVRALPHDMRATVADLAAWQSWSGVPYRHTPGLAAHDWIRAMPRRTPISWAPYRDRGALPGWEPPTEIKAFNWTYGGPVAGLKWDTKRAYLRAMSGANFPAGPLHHTGTAPEGPGYVRVRAWAGKGIDPPAVYLLAMMGIQPDLLGSYWLGTECLSILTNSGYQFEIIESQTAPGSRLLRSWAEKVDNIPDAACKPVYAEAFGMFATNTGAIQRRDWHHLIIDYANATLLRRILNVHNKLNIWPVAVYRADSVVYEVPDARESELSALLGKGMRFEGAA